MQLNIVFIFSKECYNMFKHDPVGREPGLTR